jgi:hypothetical protein
MLWMRTTTVSPKQSPAAILLAIGVFDESRIPHCAQRDVASLRKLGFATKPTQPCGNAKDD